MSDHAVAVKTEHLLRSVHLLVSSIIMHIFYIEIISKVMSDNEAKRFRPAFPQELDGIQTAKQSYAIKKLIQSCWIEDPMMRPTIKTILKTLNRINPYK